MTSPVLSALIPVVLLIAIGFMAGRWRWIGPVGAKEHYGLVTGDAVSGDRVAGVN